MKHKFKLTRLWVASLLLLFGFTTNAWANETYVVGGTTSNPKNYSSVKMKLGTKPQGWETWQYKDMSKAKMTFEGKALWVTSYETSSDGNKGKLYNMQFQLLEGSTWKEEWNAIACGGTSEIHSNEIADYDNTSWYSKLTMSQSHVYFDATDWTETAIKLVIGHANYQGYYDMTRLTNTNLYYNNSNYSWGDAMGFGIVGRTSRSGASSNWLTDVSANASEYTGFRHYGLNNNTGGYLVTNKGNAGEKPDVDYKDSYSTLLDKKQTISVMLSTNGGNSYSSSTWRGKINANRTYMSSATATTTATKELDGTDTKTYASGTITSTFEFEEGTTNTGYTFVGFSESNSTKPTSNAAKSYTVSDAKTIYAFYKANGYQVEFDGNGATSGSMNNEQYYYGVSQALTANAFERTNYNFVGWNTDKDATTVLYTDKKSVSNLSSTDGDVVTLYAIWALDQVDVTYGVFGSAHGTIRLGSGTPITGNTTQQVDGASTVVFTATPDANYTVEGWYSNSTCTGDKLQDGDNTGAAKTYTIPNIAADKTVYVKFRETTRTITVQKGTGISSVSPSSTSAYVTTTSADISATLKDGYTNLVWNLASGITAAAGYTTSSNPIKVNAIANGTITANATEILHSVSVASNDVNKGTVNVASVSGVGIATASVEITATPKAGYYFTGWTIPDGVTLAQGYTQQDVTIKINATADGITITANFAGKYAFRGSLNDGQDTPGGMPGWSNNDPIEFTNGTASVSYTLQANKTYKFKLRDKSTSGYAGYQNSGNIAMNGAYHLFNGTNNVYLATQGAGEYTFDIRFNSGTPEVKVTGPTSYTITFGKGAGGSTITAISSIDGTITTEQYVKSGANVTFSQTAATGYHFVEWNTKSDKSGTQLGTNETLVLSNVTENKTVYSIYAKTDYNITYPSGTNYTIEKTKDVANYQDNVTFKATPKDGYRLAVTAKDASEQTVTLNHDDFSYDYSFSMPASNVTISVTEYPYLIGGNFANGGGDKSFDSEKYTFDENHQHTFTLNALTSYKFKIYNDTYKGTDTYGSDHYMGMNGDWVIDHTTLNSEVTCAGAACFVIKTGITGQYTIKVKTGENNKPVVDIIYPNVSKLVYGGQDYPFTDLGNGTWKAGPLSLAASKTFDDDIRMYWEGTCIKNDNDNVMTAGSHTDWGMVRYTEGTCYIKLTTAGSDNTFAKDPDNYYFYYKPNASPKPALTVEYPSYWRGDDIGWEYNHPMEFVNDVATIDIDVQTAGDRKMKVIVDGQYWTKVQTISTSTNDIEFVKDASANTEAFKFNVASSMKGIYTFTFNRATHKMSVNYPDTVQYDITYTDAEGTKTIKAGPNGGRGISAANKPGYKFVCWELSPDDINVIDVAGHEMSRQTTTVYGKAPGGSITAIYTNEHFIYFKNIPNWSDVYVQFYSNPYFHGDDGTGDKNKGTGTGKNNDNIVNGTVYHMTHIDKTDIWYFDYSAFASAATEKHTVAFTDSKQEKHDFFDQCQVVYRGDFGECAPMMVPINYIDQYLNQHNNQRTCYYGQGHWMKYDAAKDEAMGIQLHIYDKVTGDDAKEISGSPWNLLADNDGSYSSHIDGINLPTANYTYGIKLSGCATGATWYGNTGKMTSAECSNWVMSINTQNMGFEAKSAGPYTFRLTTGDGQLKLSAEYPLVENDFRVIHTEGGNTHITGITYKHANAKADTASFYFNISETSPVFKVQKCTDAANDTWADVSGAIFTNPTQTGIYNFIFSHDGETVTIQKTEPYTGNYYVRCEALNGGLENYEANADNRMNYTTANPEFATSVGQEGYNYYKTRWITIGKDVAYTVANDYSKNISATMTGDNIIGESVHNLPADANVRFTWNSNTNALSRAYIRGSSNKEDKFVVVYGTYVFSDQECTQSLTDQDPGHFKDNQDWVYEYTLYATTGAIATVKTSYNDHPQILINNQAVFSSTKENDKATLRTLYDFKTNRFVAAWTPPTTAITSEYSINADIMLMRNGQQQADQMTFGDGGSITGEPKTIYGAVKFEKSLMENDKTYDRSIFWISFPFDVRLNDVFGLGQYGKYWIIRYYDGAERASKGWFQETKTFWKTVSVEEREHGGEDKKGFVLKANEGYNLVLDYTAVLKDLYPNGATENYLFFPSKDKIDNILASLLQTSITYDPLTCTITSPENRTNEDSNWRVIGVPSYADPGTLTASEGIKFYYAWNSGNNTLGVDKVQDNPREGESSGTFQSMHAYMVQFAGTINWSTKTVTPATAPLFAQTEKEEYSLRLELQQEGKKVDQAYVDLTDEATEEFDLNLDITKLMYSTSQIYSFIGNDKVAANSLPVRDVVVPLCVTAAADGTYTIALPDGTEGLNVTLYDVTAGKETNMSFDGYTVNLNKGEYNNRFLLNISVPRVPTNIRNANGEWSEDGKTKKLLINDNIYLINAGRIYNASGTQVK